MTPPQSSNRPHPLEKGFLTPSLDFGFMTDDVLFFLENFFENLTSQKKFRRLPPAKIFCVKICDFLKFATPPDIFMTSLIEFFMTPL